MFAVSVGVGNDEEPVPEVRGTNGCRRYALPFEVVPEGDQVGGNLSESESKDSWHVFQQHPFGSYQAKACGHVRPQMSGVVGAAAGPGMGERLAGESTANKVRSLNRTPVDSGDIAQVGHMRVVPGQDPAAVRFDL
jgi:hypothetical protein